MLIKYRKLFRWFCQLSHDNQGFFFELDARTNPSKTGAARGDRVDTYLVAIEGRIQIDRHGISLLSVPVLDVVKRPQLVQGCDCPSVRESRADLPSQTHVFLGGGWRGGCVC